MGFDQLVDQWEVAAAGDLDRDRVGVFWALLFLSSQGRVELEQEGWLHGPLRTEIHPREWHCNATADPQPSGARSVADPVGRGGLRPGLWSLPCIDPTKRQ